MQSNAIAIHSIADADRAWIRERATELWGADFVVSRGIAHRMDELPGFVATINGERVGVATYRIEDDACELVSIDALTQHEGIGTRLLDAVREVAGERRLWLITTNDNLDAMRFYQRRGFVLCAVHVNSIEQSRRVKPQIPRVGCFGIPIRDELEFERVK